MLSVSDEWFCSATNLTNPKAPIHKPDTFTEAGAWYDGWETRRHNPKPFDYVVFGLGIPSGRVKGVEIDTGFFSGNQAPEIEVQGCYLPSSDVDLAQQDGKVTDKSFSGWETILSKQSCGPACRQAWLLHPSSTKDGDSNGPYTHIRLLMYPDGGIGRFRLYGHTVPVFPSDPSEVIDLAAMTNGGVATRCSDQHFGRKDNLLLPGRGVDMGDGWETKRSREKGHVDWVIVKLGAPGEIAKLIVDTAHFKGNFPQKVQIFGAEGTDEPAVDGEKWTEILAPTPMGPHKIHEFTVEKGECVGVRGKLLSWVKLVMIPDGGIKRLRVFGRRQIQA